MEPILLKKIQEVPTLPTVMHRLLRVLDDPGSSAGEVEYIASHDPALSSKLLGVANSAYYGSLTKITTVDRAVVTLGFAEVRNILLGLSLTGIFKPASFPDREEAEQLWLHSLAVAEAARLLAQATGAMAEGPAFTAGLLHDIGKVVMGVFFPDAVSSLKLAMAEKKISFREAERQMEMDHQSVGRLVAQQWELPPLLVAVIGDHHDARPSGEHARAVCLISLADYLARSLEIGDSWDPDPPLLDPTALTTLCGDAASLRNWKQSLAQRREEIQSYWNVMVRGLQD